VTKDQNMSESGMIQMIGNDIVGNVVQRKNLEKFCLYRVAPQKRCNQ